MNGQFEIENLQNAKCFLSSPFAMQNASYQYYYISQNSILIIHHQARSLLGVLPSRRSIIIDLRKLPRETNAALPSVAALDPALGPNPIPGIEVIDFASKPILALKLQLPVINSHKPIVDRRTGRRGAVRLRELELAGELPDGVVALGHVDLLAAGDDGGEE